MMNTVMPSEEAVMNYPVISEPPVPALAATLPFRSEYPPAARILTWETKPP
ncbi:hypothetical protein SAMN06265795_109100 [Noviherbaspirillum humi]|uniref:Uncharacterized protein n=1 Tax=Noviherbaspirillum humi TaxID=1688639 RepID=A0A239IG23_9BURK|nr:hypothetical protein SAMN06265795_109100 [Noviherbaspirillum humi]